MDIKLTEKEYQEFTKRLNGNGDTPQNKYLAETARRVGQIQSLKINGMSLVSSKDQVINW